MKYEHKTVGINWFDAVDLQEGYGGTRTPRNVGGSSFGEDPENNGWHVVGVIANSTSTLDGGSNFTKSYFLLERVVSENGVTANQE